MSRETLRYQRDKLLPLQQKVEFVRNVSFQYFRIFLEIDKKQVLTHTKIRT